MSADGQWTADDGLAWLVEAYKRDAIENAEYAREHGRFNVWLDDKTWWLGEVLERLGDRLIKLGCRSKGELPIGILEAYALGESGEYTDEKEVVDAVATEKARHAAIRDSEKPLRQRDALWRREAKAWAKAQDV